ncbi:hypothetical protein SLS56_007230 [Neofusicoccum ribis]|uniref:DUF8212 domain-containing protein n=1 Tax=Neofusicoccum ribis TaxID=45134 RepID=A0ABR3SNE7_9PEZI
MFARNKKGYGKIVGSCKQAAKDRFGYIWVDTCCIDKQSSAELSEAINSIEADICYAYLADVTDGVDPEVDAEFAESEWFGRGWTLQELVAPAHVVFFSSGWVRLGDKASLCEVLSEITWIDGGVLAGTVGPRTLSVAQRMPWSAKRMTTRPEDVAYCLMGLFDINMPMLYGEGGKAFIRLQEEIMRASDDESLFAWVDRGADPDVLYGLPAKSPAWFAEARGIERSDERYAHPPFSMTNKGLHIQLPLVHGIFSSDVRGELGALINCRPDSAQNMTLGIAMTPTDAREQYARIKANTLLSYHEATEAKDRIQSMYVRQDMSSLQCQQLDPSHLLRLGGWPSFEQGYTTQRIWGATQWKRNHAGELFDVTAKECFFPLSRIDNNVAAILEFKYSPHDSQCICVVFASSLEFGVVFDARSVVDSPQARADNFRLLAQYRQIKPHKLGSRVQVDVDNVRVHVVAELRDEVLESSRKWQPRRKYTTVHVVVQEIALASEDVGIGCQRLSTGARPGIVLPASGEKRIARQKPGVAVLEFSQQPLLAIAEK